MKNLDYYLILDLEGKTDILEFPVILVEIKNKKISIKDIFHEYVIPVKFIEIYGEDEYKKLINRKYYKMNLEEEYFKKAKLNFKETINKFTNFLNDNNLILTGEKTNCAFITCGDWDIKSKFFINL